MIGTARRGEIAQDRPVAPALTAFSPGRKINNLMEAARDL
jgi:hypothetical protein